MAQIGSYRTMLQIGTIRVLYEATYVAICIAQIFGEGVSSQEIKAICKSFVQRRLEGVVEHLQLWKIEGKHRSHIGLLIEVSSAEVWKRTAARGGRPAEIGIENLRCLVKVARFMVPQVIGARAYVGDLRDPVLCELVLHIQIPLHNDGNDSLRTSGLHRAFNVDRVPWRYCRWKAGRDELRGGWWLARVEVLCHESKLSGVESEVVENIRFGGIEDSEGASDHSIAR